MKPKDMVIKELKREQGKILTTIARRHGIARNTLLYWQQKTLSPTWPPLPIRDFIKAELEPIKKQLGVILNRVGRGGKCHGGAKDLPVAGRGHSRGVPGRGLVVKRVVLGSGELRAERTDTKNKRRV